MNLLAFLMAVTVTIRISQPVPTPKNPHGYGLFTCTGVFISPNEILTAGHCMARARKSPWVKTYEGEKYTATIEKVNPVLDLSLIKIDKPISHTYVTLSNVEAQRSDPVYTLNTGGDYEHTYNEGIVNNLILEDDTSTPQLMHNASIMHGASGSGLFNKAGKLIGINVALMQPFSFAVDLSAIKAFLSR